MRSVDASECSHRQLNRGAAFQDMQRVVMRCDLGWYRIARREGLLFAPLVAWLKNAEA
jgi:hypothetical protein